MKTYLTLYSSAQISLRKFGILFLLGLFSISVFAEGTKEIQPIKSKFAAVDIIEDNYKFPFANYNGPIDSRLNIKICNAGEKIYFGFRQDDGDVNFRLKDPNGNIVFASQGIPKSGQGFINTWDEAVAGPKQVVGASGYDAFSYTSLMAGDYYIEFEPTKKGRRLLTYLDFTVTSGAGVVKPGRLWSKAWSLNVGSFKENFMGKMFVYSDDQIVTSVDFNGIQPYHFIISANSTGTKSTGSFTADRQSVSGLQTYPQYKLFLNDPDNSCYPTGTFGNLTAPVTLTGCGPDRCINVTVDQKGLILLTLDLNGVAGYQPSTTDVQFLANVNVGLNCIKWDAKDGLGNDILDGTKVDLQVDFLNGITHLPLYDVENHLKGYSVSLVRPAGGAPKMFWDDTKLNGGGFDLTGCASPCHTWGTTNADDNTIGNVNTLNTYWYANIVKGAFPFDIKNINVDANTTMPGVGGLNDTTICNGDIYKLSGFVAGATGGVWSTPNGSISGFSSLTDLKGTYTPTAADYGRGFVDLVLTTTGNGSCPARSDFMKLKFENKRFLKAGISRDSTCSNNPDVQLQGQANESQYGITWTGGTGTYIPNNKTKNAWYHPSADDIAKKKIVLTIEADPTKYCKNVKESITLSFFQAPIIDVVKGSSSDTMVSCAADGSIQLDGDVKYIDNPASNNLGYWQGAQGWFDSPVPGGPSGNAILNAIYHPSQQELAQGYVRMTLTSHQRFTCLAETGTLTILFEKGPTLDAGASGNVCTNTTTFQLNATISKPSPTKWIGGTGTFSPNRDVLNPTYTLSPAEITTGKVKLYIENIPSGNCAPSRDSVEVSVLPGPDVNVVPDNMFVCANNPDVQLSATNTNSSGVQWITGDGSFIPNKNSKNPTYIPSADEIALGLVSLVVKTSGNGSCNPDFDTVNVIITPLPEPNPVKPADICANNPIVKLSGTTTNTSKSTWTGGGGTFNPNATTLNANYTPSLAEINSGKVTLTLTAERTGCNAVSKSVTFFVSTPPAVEAGPDQSICKNNTDTKMNGSVTNASGAFWSGGTGSFTPSNTDLNAVYKPSAAEITAGKVKLYLTSTGNGLCSPVKDSVTITFTPIPTVNPGVGSSFCSNNATITLNGSSSTGSVLWKGGTGTFTPNRSTKNAQYIPSASELTAGTVTLTLESAANGNCIAISGPVTYTFTPSPTISITSQTDFCSDVLTIPLTATETISSNVTWTGGSGVFTPSNTGKSVTYKPTSTEILNGSVTLTATTVTAGNCSNVSANTTLNFQALPVVKAGSPQTLCGNVNVVQLNGTLQNASSATWTTSGTGTFLNNKSLTSTYTPSAADKTAGKVTLTLTSDATGKCGASSDQMLIQFTEVPVLTMGPNETICSGNFPITLTATGSAGAWTGGSGTFNPNRSTHNAIYTPTATELNSGSVALTFTTTLVGACPSLTKNVNYTLLKGPQANAGGPKTVCGDTKLVPVTGSVSNATGGFWTTTGNGSFVSSASVLNNTYKVSPIDTSMGKTKTIKLILSTTGNGVCATASDTALITFQPAVVVNAGPTQTFCESTSDIQLNGTQKNATSVVWSGGAGAFSPSKNVVNPIYTPTVAEKNAGTLTLTLTSSASGECPPIGQNVVFKFDKSPIVTSGLDYTICEDSAYIQLNGSVSNASGGYWITNAGKGVFSPNNSDLKARYYFSTLDAATTVFDFTLVSSGSGTCDSVSSTFKVTKLDAPEITAGNDTSLCGSIASFPVKGKVSMVTTTEWKTSGSGTFTNKNALATNYIPSKDDYTNGTVVLTLSTTNQVLCKPVSDQFVLTLQKVPGVLAGFDQTVCADLKEININGSVNDATSAVWSVLKGSGTISNVNKLSTKYVFAPNDTVQKEVKLVLTSLGNGLCSGAVDTISFKILPIPIVEAGPSIVICADSNAVQLNGTISNAGGGRWYSKGSGLFLPSDVDMNAKYLPSALDIQKGNIRISLFSEGNGTCNSVSDTLHLTINPAPSISALDVITECSDIASIPLNRTIKVATGAYWKSSGNGTFSPDSASVNANYIPSATDRLSKLVNLTLTTTGNDICKPVTSSTSITLIPTPQVNAGLDINVCASDLTVRIDASDTNTVAVKWRSSGSGTFSPSNATTKNVEYVPSQADKNSGSVTLILDGTGIGSCSPTSDTVIINFNGKPTLALTSPADLYCAEQGAAITLNATLSNTSGGKWSTTGTGSFSPSETALNPKYILSDTDGSLSSLSFVFKTNDGLICAPVSDTIDLKIQAKPTSLVGNDLQICKDFDEVVLDAKTTNKKIGKWTTSGTGLFVPSDTAQAGFYLPSDADKDINGGVKLTYTASNDACTSSSDELILSFTPAPTLNAGTDLTVCTGIDSVGLNSSFTVATGVVWTTFGTGSFFPADNVSNPTYVPSSADQAAKKVKLVVRTFGEGGCATYFDSLFVNFTDVPVIDAGVGRVVCENDFPFQLQGSGTTGEWSGGTGTFTPSRFALDAFYTPSAAEVAANKVKLYLTTIKNGSCLAGLDSVEYALSTAPILSISNDTSICADQKSIALSSKISGVATGVTWKSDGSGSFSNGTILNPTYSITPSDVAKRNIQFVVTTTGNNGNQCSEVIEYFNVAFTSIPILSTADSLTVCENNRSIKINSGVTNASGVNWTGGTGSFTPSRTSLAATYTPTDAEATTGKVTLTLNSTGTTICSAVSKTVELKITKSPTLALNVAPVFCEDASSIPVSATVTNAAGLLWTTTGNGSFVNATMLNTAYKLALKDTSLSTIKFTASTTGNGNCLAISKDTVINLLRKPRVDAGDVYEVCSSSKTVLVKGTSKNSVDIVWRTTGSGTFADSTVSSTVYTFGSKETTLGGVNLIFSSKNNTICKEVQDVVFVQINKDPSALVNAGSVLNQCADTKNVPLTAKIERATGGVWYGGKGGKFNPDTTSLTSSYIPSSADSSAGKIQIFFKTTGNGICTPAIDTLDVTLFSVPTINMLDTVMVCADTLAIELTAKISNAGGGFWTTSGNGTFVGSASDVPVDYVLSETEILNRKTSVTLTTTLNGVCSPQSENTVILIDPKPILTTDVDFKVCSNEPEIKINSTVKNAGGVQWSTTVGKGNFTKNDLEAIYLVAASDPESKLIPFMATTINNGLCKPVSKVVNVTFQMAPEITLGPDFDMCDLEDSISTFVTAENAASYRWSSNGSGFFTPSSSDPNAVYLASNKDKSNGTVQLTLSSIADKICKAVSSDFTVTFISEPEVTLTIGNLCERDKGAQLNVKVDNLLPGTWATSGTGVFSATATQYDPVYFPSPEDLNNDKITLSFKTESSVICGVKEVTGILLIDPLPFANAGIDRYICKNGTTVLSAESNAANKTYKWFNKGGVISSKQSVSVQVPIQETYALEVADYKGCLAFDTVKIFTYDLPALSLDPHYCYNEQLVLDSKPTPVPTVPGIFQWYKDQGIISGANTPVFAVKNAGTHLVKFEFQECFTDASTSVTLPPVLDTKNEVACIDESVRISTTELPLTNYTWTLNNKVIGSTYSIKTNTIKDSTLYRVKAMDALGCITFDSTYVVGIVKPKISIPDSSSCEGKEILLVSTPSNVSLYELFEKEYSWKKDQQLISTATTDSLLVKNSGTYTGSLQIGQCITSDDAVIMFNVNPVSQLQQNPEFCKEDNPNYVVLDPGKNAVTYLWSTGDTTRTINAGEEKLYTVLLTNIYNCTTKDSTFLIEVCKPRVYVSTAFIPGGNGEDAYFQVFGTHFTQFRITIYNRWGEVMYDSIDQYFKWDGTYKNKLVEPGVYPYLIQYEGDNEENKGPFMLEGKVTILH